MTDRRAVASYFRPLGMTVAAALLVAPLLAPPLALAQQTPPASQTTAGRPATPAVPAPATTPTAVAPPVAALPGDAAVVARPGASATPVTSTTTTPTPTTATAATAPPVNAAPSPTAPATATTPETATAPATAPVTAPATPPATAPLRQPPQVAMPTSSGPGFAGLLQTIFALLLVLGLLIGLAWMLKRYGPKAGGGTANLRVVGALNIGGRERIMVVEVGDQWIVVGAAPGRVNALHTMPRQESEPSPGSAQGGIPSTRFADWLKHTMDKRNAS